MHERVKAFFIFMWRYVGSYQKYLMNFFSAKTLYGFLQLTIFAKSSTIDNWQGSKYASVVAYEGNIQYLKNTE